MHIYVLILIIWGFGSFPLSLTGRRTLSIAKPCLVTKLSAHWDRHRHAIKVWISSTFRYARRSEKSWLLRLCNFLWLNNKIWCVFWVIANLCSARLWLHWSGWHRCSFRKLKLDWFRRWSWKIFLSYFWTRGCVMWRSICVTGNPNWWVWVESLLCSWKWFGCSLSNLLVLVDGLHNWY